MFSVPQKKASVPAIAIVLVFFSALVGCGDSAGVTTLNACLSDFSQMVDNYKTEVGSDNSKQAEWDAKVAQLADRWTNIRNEYGSDITPQNMEKMVQQYESLMLSLSKFKKTIGS